MTARCPRCGAAFECRPGEGCWCEAIPARRPVEDVTCLCPTCLTKLLDGEKKATADSA